MADGDNQVTVEDARTFLSENEYIPADKLGELPDDQVLETHGLISKVIEKHKGDGALPDNWREEYVKRVNGDDKLLKRMQRYSDPYSALDALVGVQNKISAGELRSMDPFPAKGTEEEQTKWREDHGIPPTPDKYEIKLGEGLVPGEADQPMIDEFMKQMHARNAPPEVVNGALEWYYTEAERQAAERHALDKQQKEEIEDALRVEWGTDFRKNKDMIEALLDTWPAGSKDLIFGARLADGTPLASNINILRGLSQMAREQFGDTFIAPAEGAGAIASITDEIDSMKTLMADKNSKYWKGPESAKLQARYRDLVAQQKKIESRGGK